MSDFKVPPKAKGFKRLFKALFYSKDGLKCAWVEESAFRQIIILALFCIALASYLAKDFLEWGLLIVPCFYRWWLNSSIALLKRLWILLAPSSTL